jgi:hypothetical protein
MKTATTRPLFYCVTGGPRVFLLPCTNPLQLTLSLRRWEMSLTGLRSLLDGVDEASKLRRRANNLVTRVAGADAAASVPGRVSLLAEPASD